MIKKHKVTLLLTTVVLLIPMLVGIGGIVDSVVLLLKSRTSKICMADNDRTSCTCRYRTEPSHGIAGP